MNTREMNETKIVAVIPAHLASVRFPRKILHNFYGLPMIEHVRRRALLSQHVKEVFVATCDQEIAEVIEGYGGKVILTSNQHKNGTTRVAEAINSVDCSHVILLQGDEPLLLPRHVDQFAQQIIADPSFDAWNAVGPIESEEELNRHSFVKCAVDQSNKVLFCFRKTPCFSPLEQQQQFVKKILGVIAYQKYFLLKLAELTPGRIEHAEFIEQMRIIEHGYHLQAVPVDVSLPSVNEVEEANIVCDYLESHAEQKACLQQILATAIPSEGI